MITRIPQSHSGRHVPHWWANLLLWQRALLVVVVLGALVISAGLIYYGPRMETGTPTGRATPATTTTTPGPMYPPGSDEYYYWGQSQPLSQQP
jgi:hypothetical protein